MKENRMTGKKTMATRTLASCALLAALSVVLARLFSLMPDESSRFSIEAIPIFLAGIFFGPVAGALVGFTADFVGCLFSPYPYNPVFCVPPILYGLFGGVCRSFLKKKVSMVRLFLGFAPPVIFGSILYQSFALAAVYYSETFVEGLLLKLTTRSVQFAVVWLLDTLIIYLLFRTRIFSRMGLWSTENNRKEASTMTASQAIDFIQSVSWKGSVPGLERPQKLMSLMGDPQNHLKYIHIGGTNGKGSTCAMLASVLSKAGYKVGLYTSPHIYCFNERIQINGENISDEDLAAVTAYVKPLAESMGEDIPTEFELVFCIATEYFKRQGCDIVVTEVGMGGEMDATNVIPAPEVAVITNIGLDHTGFLGNTVEEIARTKAGIFKKGSTAVIYPSGASVEAVLEGVCEQLQIPCRKADFSTIRPISHSLEGQTFVCGSRTVFLPLLGQHQQYNCCMALNVLDVLLEKGWHITEEQILDGLKDTVWPGRFHIMEKDPLFIIDGGHNPQCLEALVKNMEDYLPGRRIIGLTGVLADKDYGEMYKPVMPYIQEFVCITPPSDRKLEAAELAQHLERAGAKATACDTIAEGVKTAKQLAGTDGVVLCFGSLYSIGDIQNALCLG